MPLALSSGARADTELWDTSLAAHGAHGSSGRGNIVLSDGSVHTWNTRQMREQIALELATGSTNVVLSKPQGNQ